MANLTNSRDSASLAATSDRTERARQVVAARRLVQVLELAEALPFTPKRHLDPPPARPTREPVGSH